MNATKIIILLLVLTGFYACTEPFTIKTNNADPTVVIYGYLTDELRTQSIQVSLSSPYFHDEKNQSISGALVKIEGSDHSVIQFTEDYAIPGLYQSITPVAGVPGVTYILSVSCDMNGTGELSTFQATSTMQEAIEVDSIQIKPQTMAKYHFFSVNLFAQDPPEKDYYLCKYVVNDSIVMKNLSWYQVIDDEIYNGEYIDGLWIYDFRNGNYKNDFDNAEEDSMHFYVFPGDQITLEISKIEKDYFLFINDCLREKNGSNPFFGGPPANIRTNILGGGIGYFTTYSIKRSTAIVPDDKLVSINYTKP